MVTEHIVTKFDEDLNQLDNLIAEMGGHAEHQFADSIKGLIRRDTELAEKVILNDKRIDAIEVAVDQHTISMLALRQPMADDLRVVITALRIASIIERIGDYSKNISKRTVAITQSAPVGPARTISRMGDVVQGMINTVLDAYLQRNADLAEDVRQRDEEVDALHTSLISRAADVYDGRPQQHLGMHAPCYSLPRTSNVSATMRPTLLRMFTSSYMEKCLTRPAQKTINQATL